MRNQRPVTQRQSWWLLASALAAFVPLARQLPDWLVALVVGTLLARALISWRQWHLPPRILLIPLTLAVAGTVLWYYRTLFGRTPGVALLSAFIALKLLELRVARDALSVVLLAYFLVLVQFMFDQSVPTALFALLTVLITTAALAAVSDDRPPPQALLRRSALMLAQGLPFMLVLFVLFPRIDGPLWGLPQDRFSATSGLSDAMSPGSIAQLSQSDAVAFRVKFDQAVPPQTQLYWRGPVMSAFDGRTWRVAERRIVADTPPYPAPPPGVPRVDYTLTLEPHGQHWLFALEMPASLPANSGLTRDLQAVSREPVRNRLRYRQSAVPGTRFGADTPSDELAAALAVPQRGNRRTRELALQWRAEALAAQAPAPGETSARAKETFGGTAPDAKETFGGTAPADTGPLNVAILRRAEAFFLSQRLSYTLTPPLLGADAVDEFLFDSKQGFCEHFASAFVLALREAGVPARVVAGYQGGEVNPVDGNLVVRQYDAHAWAEVWLGKAGWVRVDPTAITVPQRISDAFAATPPAGATLPLMARNDLAWLRALRDRVDALANGWNQFVLGYNAARQRDFLRSLGLREPDWQRLAALLAALCGLLMLALTAWILWQRPHTDPVERQWQRFVRKLARRGVQRHAWEGPADLAQRAAASLPAAAADIAAICARYVELRYARQAHPDALARLRAAVNGF